MHHLTNLGLPTPAARENHRRHLAIAVGAFLAAGGTITQCATFESKPLPPRPAPVDSPEPAKRRASTPPVRRISEEREAHLVENIRASAAQGMTRTKAASIAGIGESLLRQLSKQHGITFTSFEDARQRHNLQKSKDGERRRKELAPKVRSYAHMGTIACAAMLKISTTLVRTVAKEHGITLASKTMKDVADQFCREST